MDDLVSFVRRNAHPTMEHKAEYLLGMASPLLLSGIHSHLDNCFFCDEELLIWKEVLPPDYTTYTKEELLSLMCRMEKTVEALLFDATVPDNGKWELHHEHGRRS